MHTTCPKVDPESTSMSRRRIRSRRSLETTSSWKKVSLLWKRSARKLKKNTCVNKKSSKPRMKKMRKKKRRLRRRRRERDKTRMTSLIEKDAAVENKVINEESLQISGKTREEDYFRESNLCLFDVKGGVQLVFANCGVCCSI